MLMYRVLLPLRVGWMLVLGLQKEDYLYILNVCPFDYTAVARVVRLDRKPANHTSCVVVVKSLFVCQLTVLSQSAIVYI